MKVTIAETVYVGLSNEVLLAQHNAVVVFDIVPVYCLNIKLAKRLLS